MNAIPEGEDTQDPNDGVDFTVVFTPSGGGDSGCIINSDYSLSIPAGTTSVSITVTVNCNMSDGVVTDWNFSIS